MTLKNILTKAGLTAGALLLAGATIAKADQIIPVVSEANGAHGSYWNTSVQLYNPSTKAEPATATLYKSGGQGTYTTTYTLQPGETTTLEGILTQMGTTGTGTLVIDADVEFIGEARIYNDAGDEGTQGQQFPVYSDSELYTSGSSGTVMLGSDISKFRSNFGWYQQEAGTVKHDLIDENGNIVASKTKAYSAHWHEQDEAGRYFGITLGDNWRVQSTVQAGSGIGYGSVVDNTSQDPTTKKMYAVANQTGEPRIIGIDFDNDGVADWKDENGDGILDGAPMNVSCSLDWPEEFWLIAENAGENPTYTGVDMPQGMGVNAGTGSILYDPPCSDSGQVFTPGFYVSGMEDMVIAQFRVGD